jgi:hypothetical protein
MRFTIRDLLWLTTVAAVAFGGFLAGATYNNSSWQARDREQMRWASQGFRIADDLDAEAKTLRARIAELESLQTTSSDTD